MRYYIFFLFFLVVLACQKSNDINSFDVSKSKATTVIANKMDINYSFFISLYSFIQANNSGLYITPSNVINDTVLYKYPKEALNKCCGDLEGIIREGRGPNELSQIFASSKSVTGDTLLFYSPNSAKYLGINNDGVVIDSLEFQNSKTLMNTGNSFSYSKGYFLIPSFNRFFSSKNLFSIINTNNNTSKDIFEPRVPPGYEPAIRNQVVAMGALPNGFAVSFVGDRKIYIIGFNGEVKKQLIFGESEPIPEPFKVKNPKQAPSSKPYITKIEFYKGHILVLMDNLIWILDYPSYQTNNLLKILRDPKENSAPVIDFSITEDVIYVRMGRGGLHSVKTNPNWFK
ncbi:hypothetical protein [Fodinibius halophilus]|uniref:Lipoprotein n=1 Tax=Fodinibius halophilus TaxID=1736908 RepID=A0A6M1TF46_9BACT|nr:hypothetical protein [Fodinibius halophilus]NGP89404.1 hypothetical protein [Fodinibius halophilus]